MGRWLTCGVCGRGGVLMHPADITLYLLHPLIGRGYQFWSGAGSDFGEVTLIVGVLAAFRRWNCNERGCFRHGYPHGDHGRPVCNKHYESHDPKLGEQ